MGPPTYIGGNLNEDAWYVSPSTASMGPPTYIGGNHEELFSFAPHPHRFNGATDLHRWKRAGADTYLVASSMLQWGHRLTSVETRLLFAIIVLFMVRFNGATDLHRWKLSTCQIGRDVWVFSFNGATDLHRWKPGIDALISIVLLRFNGATDLHRWKRENIEE